VKGKDSPISHRVLDSPGGVLGIVLKLGHVRLVDHVIATAELRKSERLGCRGLYNLCGGNRVVEVDSSVSKSVSVEIIVGGEDSAAGRKRA